MGSALFYGSATALVTPFRGGRVDYDALERLIDWQIDSEADALLVLGTTGEPSTVTQGERRAIIECAVTRCAGRVPLLVGTGNNDTRRAVEYSVEAQLMGADALVVVTPYYNRASQSGLTKHFRAVADAVEIPIILYNVPARTGVCMAPETALELARHPMIRGVKEAHGEISHMQRLASLCGEGLALYAGSDECALTMMALGARGAITVAGNVVPETMHDLTVSYLRGDVNLCRALQFQALPLMEALASEVNPIPVKAALSMMGRIENELRLPLTPLDEARRTALQNALVRAGALQAPDIST